MDQQRLMNAIRKLKSSTSARSSVRGGVAYKAALRASAVKRAALQDELNEEIEDARLNAIADERANGPFIKVSLDDL